MSNARSGFGQWNDAYKSLDENVTDSRYSEEFNITYRMAASFLADQDAVEDWGCGTGGFRNFFQGQYVGVDGSQTPFASKIEDLCSYKTKTDCILLRHVLEHNFRWREILSCAVSSFEKKLCLILFTPFAESETKIGDNSDDGVNVPDLSLPKQEIEDLLAGCKWRFFGDIKSGTQYGVEHVYFVWR